MHWWAAGARLQPRHLRLLDAVAAVLLFAAMIVEPVASRPPGLAPTGQLTAATVVLSVVMCLGVALRRSWPVPVLAVVTTAAAFSLPRDGGPNPAVVAVMAAVYTVAVTQRRPVAVAAGGITALALVLAAVHTYTVDALAPQAVVLAAWAGMATAVGVAVRNRRAYVAAVEERARRAEHTREEEARRRVAEDRLRIARDLHDVLAHHIAVVNVQAGVAGYVVRSDPAAAEAALTTVRRASRSVLDELGAILSVLRQPGDDRDAPTEPAPSLSRSDELLRTARAAGTAVTWRTTGEPVALPPAADVAAYRLLQEALTNAHKHGTGLVLVDVCYSAEQVRIDVANAVPADPRPATGTGYGLTGMRERVIAVGGTVEAGPDGSGHFRVRAALPIEETP